MNVRKAVQAVLFIIGSTAGSMVRWFKPEHISIVYWDSQEYRFGDITPKNKRVFYDTDEAVRYARHLEGKGFRTIVID